MRLKLMVIFISYFILASIATADTTPAISTPSVSGSTIPVVSSAAVTAPVVSTSSVPSVAVSSGTAPVDHVENARLRRFVGTIQSIDPAAHKLVVGDRENHPSEFILTQRTRVMADDGHRLKVADLKPGNYVSLRYVENANYVRNIDLLPAVQ